MKHIHFALFALALTVSASPARAAGGHEGHDHAPGPFHEAGAIPETKLGVEDKLLHGFRKKDVDQTKKNGFFLDQAGNKVKLSDYRGKVVLMDFIYSGCQHGICQYLNNKMNFVANKYRDRLGKDLVLVSLSFDENDTPQTLAKFAERWGNRPAEWAYLSGLPGDIVEACREFGVSFRWNEKEDFFEHTVRTLLIGRDGKVVKVYRGREYRLQEAVDDVKAELKKK